MGFSQGAKMAASLLLEQQAREEVAEEGARRGGTGEVGKGLIGLEGVKWRFGVLLAGRAPLSNLNPDIMRSPALVSADELSEGFRFAAEVDAGAVLRKPTLHVHGLADAGLHLHRVLLSKYCDEASAALVEWDGAHRIPIKSKDVDPVVEAIYDLAEGTGVKVVRTV
jgi:hypothetical protein